MNVSFWNTYKNKDINAILSKMIIKKEIDVMVLAEYEDSVIDLIQILGGNGQVFKKFDIFVCKKIVLLYKDDIKINYKNDSDSYYSVIMSRNGLKFELFMVHFPSKKYSDDNTQNIVARRLKYDINQEEKTLIIGDFNCNPFELPIMDMLGLSAFPSKKMKTRTVQGMKTNCLYNPMWRFFDDFENIPGTYYYNSNKSINYYWNIFDQVLMSNELITNFDSDSLEIVKTIGEINLIKNEKIDKQISDHLPIFLTLKEE